MNPVYLHPVYLAVECGVGRAGGGAAAVKDGGWWGWRMVDGAAAAEDGAATNVGSQGLNGTVGQSPDLQRVRKSPPHEVPVECGVDSAAVGAATGEDGGWCGGRMGDGAGAVEDGAGAVPVEGGDDSAVEAKRAAAGQEAEAKQATDAVMRWVEELDKGHGSGRSHGGGGGREQQNRRGTEAARGRLKRGLSRRWLSRRPRVRLRMFGNPWMEVRDVAWTSMERSGTDGESSVAREVARQLSWAVKDDDTEVHCWLRMGDEQWQQTLKVHAEDEPSVRLGDEVMKRLILKGWKWRDVAATVEPVNGKPELCGEDVLYRGTGEAWGDEVEADNVAEGSERSGEESDCPGLLSDTDTESSEEEVERADQWEEEEDEFWNRLVERHQRAAVNGEEPGGLVTGTEWEVPTELMRDVADWEQELRKWEGREVPAGPDFNGPETNDAEYKERRDVFIPEHIHDRAVEWWRITPRCDSEVLRWMEHKIVVRMPESARGAKTKNGKAAREHPEALMRLMQKRLKNKTWRGARPEELISIIQLNLQPKPTADPPWRLTVWPKDANDGLSKWSGRYEGLRKLPLVITQGCWLVILDLESGYDAMGLSEETKPWFGARFYASKAMLMELMVEGLVTEECLGPRDDKGGAEVFVEPNTLPQGFAWACAIFTKVVRQMVREWRENGMRVCHMIDDLLLAFNDYVKACWGRDYILKYLQVKGWFVNWLKAVLTPTQVAKFLGFVVDTVKMRFFLPADKVLKIEGLLRKVVEEEGQQETHRSLARVVGNVVATDLAIPPARPFMRHSYSCIRPKEGEYDEKAEVTQESLREMQTVLKYLRLWNLRGGPIRKEARMCEVRMILDASEHGFGYRCNGREHQDVEWDGKSRAVAAQWRGTTYEHQVHREMAAAVQAVQREAALLSGKTCLFKSDCMAVVCYINEGVGSSTVLCEMAEDLWWFCCCNGIRLRAEHMAGVRMVAAGVDSMSRASEFVLARTEYDKLNADVKWGRRWGFKGFTVNL